MTTSAESPRTIVPDRRRLPFVLAAIALILTIGAVLRFILHDLHGLAFPYDLVAGEGLLLRDAASLRFGQPLYTPPDQFPYIVSVYPPGYTALVALASLIPGIHLTAVRIVSSAAVLISALSIAVIVYLTPGRAERNGRLWIAAVVAGFSTCGLLFIYQWGIFGRVDTVAVMWSLIGVGLALIVDRSADRPQRARQATIGAALCCLAAIYTKQTALAAPAAIGLWLLIRRPRLAVLFVLTIAVIGGGLFVAIDVSTGGEFFRQIVTDNVQAFSIRALGGYWRALILIDAPLLIGTVWYVIRAIRNRSIDLPLLYLIASGVLTVTTGRAGASISYLLEFLCACSLVVGLLWGSALSDSQSSRIAGIVLPILFALQIVWSIVFPATPFSRYYTPDPVFGYDPTAADMTACQKLDTYVAQSPDPVLAEEASILMEHGRTPIGSGWLFTALAGVAPVDQGKTALKAEIVAHAFPLILLHWQSFPVDLLNTVAANYKQIDTVQCILTWKVYVPNG